MVQPAPHHPDDDTVALKRLQRLRSGCVLLSLEQLTDPNFDTTAVLICMHNEEGAYGLVLNRPSHMPLSEIFEGFSGESGSKKVYIGGPVNQDELQLLHLTTTPAPNAHAVAPGVYLGGTWDDIEDIVHCTTGELRLFLGYSGWAVNQLELEIVAGAWEVYTVAVQRLLKGPEDRLVSGFEQLKHYLEELSC
jgi:putative transcriptional regulator